MKKEKLIKGILFVVIAVLMLFVNFYSITRTKMINGNEIDLWKQTIYNNQVEMFDLIFDKTIFNFIFSGLFFIIGVIEIKEAVKRG